MSESQNAPEYVQSITYTNSFFDDVYNQCGISSMSEDDRHDIEVIYNSFKDRLQMDSDSRIIVGREKMLCLEYFQLFMSLLHAMHQYYRYRAERGDIGNEAIDKSFRVLMLHYAKTAFHVRQDADKETTWTTMEEDVPYLRVDNDNLLGLIYDYCFNQTKEDDQLPPPPSEINIPTSDEIEDDQPGENLDTKFKEQEIMQDMDLSRAHWAAEKLMLVCRTTINICVLIAFAFIIARMWVFVGSTENGEKYRFTDAELVSIILPLIIITIITNIKTIFGWFKELSHG